MSPLLKILRDSPAAFKTQTSYADLHDLDLPATESTHSSFLLAHYISAINGYFPPQIRQAC